MSEHVGLCGKSVFPSEEAIKRLLRGRNRSGRGQGFRVGRYFCTICPGWHITNRDKSRGSTGRRY